MKRLICFALLCACAPSADTWLRHDLDSDFWGAPLPSAHRLSADGTVQLDGFPNPQQVQFVRQMLDLAQGKLRGFGTTSSIYFPSSGPIGGPLPDYAESLDLQSPIQLIDLESGSSTYGVRYPVQARFTATGGAFSAPHMLSLLPLQGRPLVAGHLHGLVVTRQLMDSGGAALGRSSLANAWLDGDDLPADIERAFEELDLLDVDAKQIAGLAAFRTQDPHRSMRLLVDDMRSHPPSVTTSPPMLEEHHDYCVYHTVVEMPVYQGGTPPYRTEGGELVFDDGRPVLQGIEESDVYITIPRGAQPSGGWPVAVFVRTGGGGDRPLIDRGVRGTNGGPALEPGTGPARDLARAGFAGFSVDGPHGGRRNITGGDEQFLMFNVLNPAAMRDNVRQSAAELALLPELLDDLTVDTSACGGEVVGFDTGHIALMGHSMGATIAPLTAALQPRYGALVLSGFGGSWIHNIMYKQSPLHVRPLAETMLRYGEGQLSTHDPALGMLQWVGESADPPAYGPLLVGSDGPHVYMAQGIVDTYIMPPIANAGALSLQLDLAGPSLDAQHADLQEFAPLAEQLSLVGRGTIDLPASGNADGRTRVVVQHPQGPVEDGHEVLFQTEGPKHQYRCFLSTWVRDGVPTVPVARGELAPCE